MPNIQFDSTYILQIDLTVKDFRESFLKIQLFQNIPAYLYINFKTCFMLYGLNCLASYKNYSYYIV